MHLRHLGLPVRSERSSGQSHLDLFALARPSLTDMGTDCHYSRRRCVRSGAALSRTRRVAAGFLYTESRGAEPKLRQATKSLLELKV